MLVLGAIDDKRELPALRKLAIELGLIACALSAAGISLDHLGTLLPGVEVYAPEWLKPSVYRGKASTLKRALMPGYLLVAMPASFLLASRAILDVRDVIGWLCMADVAGYERRPCVIPESAIHEIRLIEADINRERKISKYDLVSVVDGWREGQTARILLLDGGTKRAKIQEIDPATGRDVSVRPYWISLTCVVPLVSPAKNRAVDGVTLPARAA